MRSALARLRWQLTLSHLIAIVVTLVSMVAALILIAGSWIAVQTGPDREAARQSAAGDREREGDHATSR